MKSSPTTRLRGRPGLAAALAAALLACGDAGVPELGVARRALAPGELVINEVCANPDSTSAAGDTNGDGTLSETQDEFVEVLNLSGAPLDVSGVAIADGSSSRFTFPGGTVIPAGEAAVVFGGGTPRGDFGNATLFGLVFTANLGLNNSSPDSVVLLQAGAEIDRVDFSAPTDGVSLNRNPDASPAGAWVDHDVVPGALGAFSPGARVDGRPFARHVFSADPDTGLTAGGVAVEISGAGFAEGLFAVNFKRAGQSAASPGFQRRSSGLIVAVAPPFSAGPADIEIVDAEGTVVGAGLFTYVTSLPGEDAGLPPPHDAGIVPDAGLPPPHDAGLVPDAGLPHDAGVKPEPDAGLGEDAGLPSIDDLPIDPEPEPRDAGVVRRPPVVEDGAAGCSVGGGGPGLAGLLALLGLGGRRRVRRPRIGV